MTEKASDRPAPLECPRCGYDFAGVVASWREQCPLAGVCSECGLEFQWADVLVEGRQRLPWLYEHAKGIAPIAALRTAWMALLPWRFWRRVKLHHRCAPMRALAFGPALLVMTSLAVVLAAEATVAVRFAALGARARVGVWTSSTGRSGSVTSNLAETMSYGATSQWGWWFNSRSGWQTSDYEFIWQVMAPMISLSAGFIICIVVGRSHRRVGRVRAGHLLRAAGMSSLAVFAWCASHSLLWLLDRLAMDDVGSLQWGYYQSSHMIRPQSWWIDLRGLLWHWCFGGPWWLLALALWTGAWWWSAMRRGLRLRGWWMVWLAGGVTGLLLMGVVALTLH